MPPAIPDRTPTFDPATQRWHWWSTPGQPSSFKQDQERAEPIEVIWEVYDTPSGRSWVAVTPILPGFVPFLWNISRGALWLRRPEGVWTAPWPAGLKRKDRVFVQEPCEGLQNQMNRRRPIECLPAANTNGWHPDAMDVTTTPEEYDQSLMGKGPALFVNHWPVIRGGLVKNAWALDVSPYRPLVVEMFSRPGIMGFAHGVTSVDGEQQNVLIITLPNGVRVAHPRGPVTHQAFQISGVAAVLGDGQWMPHHSQPIVVVDL